MPAGNCENHAGVEEQPPPNHRPGDRRQPPEPITRNEITFSWVFPFPPQSVILSHERLCLGGGQMSRGDEESIRQAYEQRHPGLSIRKIPRGDRAVDGEGRVYKWRSGAGGWFPTGQMDYTAATKLQGELRPVCQEKAVTGQYLYEDPRLGHPVWDIPVLPQPVLPKPNGLGALGFLGIIGFLAIIGVVIWLIVAHLGSSGYPPSRTFADSYDTSGARGVSAIAFSPDGKELVTADAYSGANLFDVASGNLIHDFNPDTVTTRVAFSPNGQLLAVGDVHGNVYVWDVASKRQIVEFTDPLASSFNIGGVYGLAFSPNGKTLAAAEFSGVVYLWDAGSWSRLATLVVPSNDSGGQAGYMAFSPNGRILAVGDSDGTTYLWDVARRTRIAILSYHNSPPSGISGVAFSPNGQTLATLGATTVLWNVSARNEVGTLPAVDSSLDNCSIAFSPTGKTLAAGCNGRSTHLWNAAGMQQIATLTGPSGNIDGIVFSPDGNTLAAGTDAGYIYLWNAETLGSK
jgi:Tol biopolymer transport system component